MGKQLEWWSSRFEDTALNDERTGMRESEEAKELGVEIKEMVEHILARNFIYTEEEIAQYRTKAEHWGVRCLALGIPLQNLHYLFVCMRSVLFEYVEQEFSAAAGTDRGQWYNRVLALVDELQAGMAQAVRRQDEFIRRSETLRWIYLLDSTHYALILFDENERCEYVNRAFLEGAELSFEEVDGHTYFDVLRKLYGEKNSSTIHGIMQEEHSILDIELLSSVNKKLVFLERKYMKTTEGSGRKLLITMYPFKYLTGYWRNALNLNFVFDYLSDAILIIDTKEAVVNCNRKYTELMGITREEIIGEPYKKIYDLYIHTDQQYSLLLRTLREKKEYRFKRVKLEISGALREILVTTRPIYARDGTEVGAVLIMRDETEIIDLQRSVERMERFQLIGQMAAGFAHEIRNPLTSIKGFLQLGMKGHTLTESNIIEHVLLPEIERINDIISKFILMSKPSAPVLRKESIMGLLDYVVKFMTPQALLEDVNLQLTIKEAHHLLYCKMDREQLIQVLLNIISNAFDALKEKDGQRSVMLSLEREQSFALITVKDNGCGMPATEVSNVFQPFYTLKESGSGLGLAISQQIVQQHGGEIELNSTPHEGTTVTIRLPLLAWD